MTNRDPAIIICSPVSGFSKAAPVARSVTITASCGHQCYVAPASLDFQASGIFDVRFICHNCVDPKMLVDPRVERYIIPGSREELNNAVGIAEADQTLAFAKEHGFKEFRE